MSLHSYRLSVLHGNRVGVSRPRKVTPVGQNPCLAFSVHGFFLAIWLAGPVEVHSATSCPSSEAIAARLSPLLPATGTGTNPADQAEVNISQGDAGSPAWLHLRLASADGSLVGQRDLPISDRCDELAETVAVLLASWESNPHAGIPPIEDPPAIAKSTPESASATSGLELQLGVGAGAALLNGAAASGRLEMGLGSLQSHWQGRIGFAGQTARQTALAPGQVSWRHSMAMVSLVWRTLNPNWLVSADIGPLLGFATLSGQDFAVNQQQNSFEFGLEAGLRAGRRWRRFTLWVDLRGESWRQRQRAVVTGTAPLALDPWDLAATLGLSVSFFP